MLKNYLKVAFRNLLKQKYYSLINVFGLSFGIAASVLIFLWVNHELSYDKFFNSYENIYRITCDATVGGQYVEACSVPGPFGPKFSEICPEVKNATRLSNYRDVVFEYGSKYFKEKKIVVADSNFFKVFSFNFIEGSPIRPFPDKQSVVLTQKLAKKYFGNEPAIGKVLMIDGTNPFTVSAVIEDIPTNSHMHVDGIAYTNADNNWSNFNWLTYVLFKDNFSEENIKNSFQDIIDNNIVTSLSQAFGMTTEQFRAVGNYIHFNLQPVTSIHLGSNYIGELETNGNKTYVLFFSIIAIFILCIACINYINLSSAYYDTRTSEVGIRKSNGATRGKLISQFLTESFIISIAAFIIGYTLIESFLPLYNNFLGIEVNNSIYNNWLFMFLILGSVLLLGIISGIFPASHISRYKTIFILRNKFNSASKSSFNTRSALVVFQYTITIIVIVATILIKKQASFLINKDLGYSQENLLIIEGMDQLGDNKEIFKNELKQNPDIVSLCYTGAYPGSGYNAITGYKVKEYPIDKQFLLKTIMVDKDYFTTYKMEIVQGKDFDPNSNSHEIVLNEKAVKFMEFDDPLNYHIETDNFGGGIFPVTGVVKNFHHDPLTVNLDPMLIISTDPKNLYYLNIRITGNNVKEVMGFITDKWNELSGNKPIEYTFLDSKLQSAYNAEMKAGNIFSIFSVLSIIIACLGILGIATYLIQRRIKEVGIRKANGAKTSEITFMFLKDFTKWVILAIIIACPVGYIAIDKWLNNFAYRTNINWWVFAIGGIIALFVALVTVSWQSWKAASTNPVESLKYE